MIRSVLTGEPFLDVSVNEVPADYTILWLTQETEHSFQPLLQRANITEAMLAGRLKIMYLSEALKAYKGDWRWEEVVQYSGDVIGGNGLLIVDTLAAWTRVRNEDSNSEMTEALGL
jgi:membrane-bound lytic murein transglycosylase